MMLLGASTGFLGIILLIILHVMVMVRTKRFILEPFHILFWKDQELETNERFLRKVSVATLIIGTIIFLVGLLFSGLY